MAKTLAHKPDVFQQQAIDSMARGIRIVAPAGSGKSETLARRVAKRIEDGVDPRRILVLTFDNAAKKSLSQFFSSLLDRRSMPQIRTLNGHGKKVLQQFAPSEDHALGGPPYTALVRKWNADTEDYPVLAWDGVDRKLTDVFGALKEQGFFPRTDGQRRRITEWLIRDYLRLPREGESASMAAGGGISHSTQTFSSQLTRILEAFDDFEEEMRSLQVMNYIDQKSRAAFLAYRRKSVMQELHTQFDEIVVDECQDISRLDASLVYYTAGPNTHVVLAGDDDQTLYEWRNAHSLYLRKPEIVFSNLEFETIHLDLNYRSPQEILGPAVKLISHNVERIEKSPTSGVDYPGTLRVLASRNENQETEQLVSQVKLELRKHDPGEIAVLLHANRMETAISDAFRKAGIPVMRRDRAGNVQAQGVELVTFLKSKGRQWPVVFIPQVNDRDIPNSDSVRKGEEESIRRRFYVAMTRASEKLVISYVRGADVDRIDLTTEGDVISTNGASRFLFEAGVVTPAAPIEEAPEPRPAPAPPSPASAPTATPEPAEPPAARPTFSPAPVSAKAKPRARHPWEPRADETRRMTKALSEWESEDYDTAVLCAWKPIESVLNRITKRTRAEDLSLLEMIDRAVELRLIDMHWRDNLHTWRRVRNQAIHADEDRSQFTREQFQDHGYALVTGAPDFFAHLAERNAPQQMALVTHDDILSRQSRIVTLIQQGKPVIEGKKPVRAIWFDAENEQFDVLTMQLLMVLRDVRFYVPDEYRWSSSPLVSKFAVDAIGFLPQGLHARPQNRLRMQPGDPLNQLMGRREKLVMQECGDDHPGVFLRQRIEDGIALENGNFHAGIKLNPRVKA